MEDSRKTVNSIKSDWFSLPEAVQQDVLSIELGSCPKYTEPTYKDFITIFEDFGTVTNKFKRLKRYLFGCFVC